MEKQNFILKGNLCFTADKDNIQIAEQGYLVCEQGISRGVFSELPKEYQSYKLEDYGDSIIIPGLVDLHIHAPQYSFRGLGMDMELLDWLEANTFPEEAKYKDLEYAKKAYSIFAGNMKRSATTRACIFATVHNRATELLMDLMEDTGIQSMVGKVNMDRNAPDYLSENTEDSVQDTVKWLENTNGRYNNVKPILTPRFIPSCTDELMKRLHEIQIKYKIPVQSHLSENQGEIAWVKELCPESEFYGDAYRQFGLFGGECRTVMAHCVSSGGEECRMMRDNGVFIAHCPESNMNLSSGIAPVRKFLDMGIKTGLGSDVAGGSTESIFAAMTDAIQVSKLRWRHVDDSLKPLTIAEAFYLATKGGGEFFGKAGSFEAGYEVDAVVIDDGNLKHPQQLTLRERLERVIYLSDDRNIIGKYAAGNKIY